MKKSTYDWRDSLKPLIERKGMNASDFSLSLGFSKSYITNCILKRRGESISDANFEKISRGLNIHPATLRYGIDLSIDIDLFNRCRKAILKAARERHQTLTEAQKRHATIQLYNQSVAEKTVSFKGLSVVLDKQN